MCVWLTNIFLGKLLSPPDDLQSILDNTSTLMLHYGKRHSKKLSGEHFAVSVYRHGTRNMLIHHESTNMLKSVERWTIIFPFLSPYNRENWSCPVNPSFDFPKKFQRQLPRGWRNFINHKARSSRVHGMTWQFRTVDESTEMTQTWANINNASLNVLWWSKKKLNFMFHVSRMKIFC